MGRIVDHEYLVSCLNQCYIEQENNCYFCFGGHCRFCRRTEVLEHQLCVKKFSRKNADVTLWLILYNGQNKNISIKSIAQKCFLIKFRVRKCCMKLNMLKSHWTKKNITIKPVT